MTLRTTAILTTVALATALSTGAAFARGGSGGKSPGDSFIDDAQRNPRFIEPYAENDPSRYRAASPRYGYDDRKAAEYYGSGYRGRVTVRPYGYGYY